MTFVVLAVGYACSALANAMGAVHLGHESVTFFMLLWGFGAFMAEYTTPGRPKFSFWAPLGVVLINVVWSFALPARGDYVIKTLVTGAAVGMALALAFDRERAAAAALVPPGKVRRSLAWLGERSYSLYAIHTPVIVLSAWALVSFSVSTGQAGVGGIVLAAALVLYNLVELRSHRLARGDRA